MQSPRPRIHVYLPHRLGPVIASQSHYLSTCTALRASRIAAHLFCYDEAGPNCQRRGDGQRQAHISVARSDSTLANGFAKTDLSSSILILFAAELQLGRLCRTST